MAEEKKSAGHPWEPLLYIVGLLIVLFILWVMNGGPERDGGIRGLFISPLPPVGSEEVYRPSFDPENINE